MAGIVAELISGWLPIDRDAAGGDIDSMFNADAPRRFGSGRGRDDIEGTVGIELATDTRRDDNIAVPSGVVMTSKEPPSQRVETTPNFKVSPFAGAEEKELKKVEAELAERKKKEGKEQEQEQEQERELTKDKDDKSEESSESEGEGKEKEKDSD